MSRASPSPGVLTTRQPIKKATATLTSATVIHQWRARYTAAGKPAVKKCPTVCQIGRVTPVTTLRALATSAERRASSTGSDAVLRTTDRWVDTRW